MIRPLLVPAFLLVLGLCQDLAPSKMGSAGVPWGTAPAFAQDSLQIDGRIPDHEEADEDSLDYRPRRRRMHEGRSDDVVLVGDDVTVREGETVEGSAVAIGGDVNVFGTVEGDAVVTDLFEPWLEPAEGAKQ